MHSFKVTDEGGGIIRVDAQTRLVRKPLASAICAEVDGLTAGYDEFKILMNMSAMSKGTPTAGLYVIRHMKKYPLRALALYGANGFMKGMARVVLGAARFSSFELFDEEVMARDWLERVGPLPPSPTRPLGPRRKALPAGLLVSGAVLLGARWRRRRRAAGTGSAGAG